MVVVAGAKIVRNLIFEFNNFGSGLSAAGARVLRNPTLCSFLNSPDLSAILWLTGPVFSFPGQSFIPVSYTHLTLPTIYSV